MKLLAQILVGVVAVSAQLSAPATPPKGTQVDDLPILGLGTWQIHNNGANVTEIIASAIESGYRHLDCAYIYQNQKRIAVGIKEGLRRTGLSRKDLWITSKVWNSRHADPEAAVQETLQELDLQYLDLYLIHWPVGGKQGRPVFDYVDTWKRMEPLVAKGYTRFLGLSNFSPRQVDDVLKVATIKPKNVQIELHPYLQQEDYVKSLHQKGISVTAYSPLANTNPVYAALGGRAPKLLGNAVLGEIARSRGCTPAQVALAWNMGRGVIVIPKAANPRHQQENIATIDKCKLQDGDAQKVKAVHIPMRLSSSPCQPLGNACFEGLEART